ncbi:MAG: hypothetical protein HQL11_03045 [Candidatus Omnitrophica bacterium]|nr:hypothetical protein [Candidatus Omnitrophota bacterium]
MKFKYRIMAIMTTLIAVTSAVYIAYIFQSQRTLLLRGIDERLFEAAEFARRVLPADYHDRIMDASSVTPEAFEKTVRFYNEICDRLGLQYLWSVLFIDGDVRFTSATSPGKKPKHEGHAGFFEKHTDPHSFGRAARTMKPDYSTFHNKWGHGRMVLLPALDSQGRVYIFGASMDLAAVDEQLREILWSSTEFALLMILITVLSALGVAHWISSPVTRLKIFAENIADGRWESDLPAKSVPEMDSLTLSIRSMRDTIREKMRELEEKNALLVKVNTELDQFVYTVSHDLRTPVRAVSAFADFMKRDSWEKMDDTARAHLEKIMEGAVRLNGLIDDLLDLSRISRVKNPYNRVRMEDLVREALGRLEYEISRSKAQVHVRPDLGEAECDAVKITQVLVNLIGNALKFVPREGERAPVIEVGRKDSAGETRYFVKDNGIGIEPKFFERIFQMFVRLHPSGTYEGSGAGLSIVKRVIEDHGGRIWVESAAGEGATFFFTLPPKTPPAGAR